MCTTTIERVSGRGSAVCRYQGLLPRPGVEFGTRGCHRRAVWKTVILLALPGLVAQVAVAGESGLVVQTRDLRLAIAPDGRITEFMDRQANQNHAAANPGPCAWAKIAGQRVPVTRLQGAGDRWELDFGESGVQAIVTIRGQERYLTWEVTEVRGDGVEELEFLDLALALRGTPDERFGACALALNLKTNVPQLPRPTGRLRAVCYPRFGLVGAAVAVIACPSAEMRSVMQQAVSAAPELPHSPLGGPWAADAPINRGSYLFNFDGITDATVDEWIELARSLGMTQIDFHGGSSFRFGDCRPNPQRYPQGRASLKGVIDQLHTAGIAAGLHTYAFFIAKDCPWVTPVPDPRLASDAVFTLAAPLPADADSMTVAESTANTSTITGFFVRNSVTLRVGQELITYTGVRTEPPFGFTGCRRGVHGTSVTDHPPGAKVCHLKECFGLFVPDPETTLFAEVAARTAETFNQCGFDMIYFDALDGEDILGGAAHGWHYGSRFVYEVWNRLKKPALMEMSTFHHHLWCVRSRYCAWDHPNRSHKRFIDLHCAANEESRAMFLPGELGWWALKNWQGAQIEPTYEDDIEYLMTKALATDTGFALMGIDPRTARTVPALPRLGAIIKRYEDLRHSGQVPADVREQLRQLGAEFTLIGDLETGWKFVPADYLQQRVEQDGGAVTTWRVQNRFARQPLRFRIQALLAAGPYEAADNITLTDFQDPAEFTVRQAQSGVTAELVAVTEADPDAGPVEARGPGGQFSALSHHPTAAAAWVQRAKPFASPLDLSRHQALGVWILGDGQGQLLNVQLRAPEHLVGTLADHYVPIDFTGWRYVELIEPEGSRWSEYQWPYGNAYAIYRESIQRGQVSELGLWYNHLPNNQQVTCKLSPIKALPLVPTRVIRPTLRVGAATLTLPVELESGGYLEFRAADDCTLYGPQGELLRAVAVEGAVPLLEPGENQIQFQCQSPPGVRARALVTVMTRGGD